jgi:hypothetical protein
MRHKFITVLTVSLLSILPLTSAQADCTSEQVEGIFECLENNLSNCLSQYPGCTLEDLYFESSADVLGGNALLRCCKKPAKHQITSCLRVMEHSLRTQPVRRLVPETVVSELKNRIRAQLPLVAKDGACRLPE